MDNCDCDTYPDLELTRQAISLRAGKCKAIQTALREVARHLDGEHVLFCCDACGQLWQKGSAWNWGAKDYLFKVPPIDITQWTEEPFVDPDEVLLFAFGVDDYLGKQEFVRSQNACKKAGCDNNAIELSALCLRHHMESLQEFGLLPRTPRGRWWGPYNRFGPDSFERVLENQQP